MSEIKELSDRDWLLKRGHNIIGSLKSVKTQSFLFNSELEEFQWVEYEAVPGLVKIINEIIDNSIDAGIKSEFVHGNEISIDIGKLKVRVEDNGYGIPIIKANPADTESDIYLPEIAWGRARAGSNFDNDDERTHSGMNGIGSYATLVYSKEFIGETDDGKNRLRLVFTENGHPQKISRRLSQTKKQGTTVTFIPDLDRFGLSEIDELHSSLIFQRILNLSILYPEIKFKFNGKLVKLNKKKFLSYFGERFEFIETDHATIAIFPNDEGSFRYHSFVNTLHLHKGGNHIDVISEKIVQPIREALIKKFDRIKPADIKNKFTAVILMRDFKNANFDGQTKEALTNSPREILDYFNTSHTTGSSEFDINTELQKMSTKILKNKSIIDPIIDMYRAKLLVEEKRKLKSDVRNVDIPEKYWPATEKKVNFFCAEGDSAITAIIAEVTRELNGFFPLKGVPLNVIKDKKKLMTNPEIKQLASILGIDLTLSDNRDLEYENFIIATDMDVDGDHIAGILLGFFVEFCPWYINNGRVFRFITPLITVYTKSGVVHDFLFDMDEYRNWTDKHDVQKSKYIYDYKKGLGTLEEQEWSELFKRYDLLDLLKPLHLLGSSDPQDEINILKKWLNAEPQFRKDQIKNSINDLDINVA